MVKLDMRLPIALAHGIPDSDTPGWIGLLVMDVTDTRMRVYRCVGIDGAAYTWEPFAAEGTGTGAGGGIDVETDPTVPAWAKQPDKPTYTADEIGAMPASTKIPSKTSDLTNDSGFVADSQVYAKDETYSQTEVDGLIDALEKRLEAVADSDDVTLDQLSEIVAYIKENKSLIDSITTSKVSVSDIVDNLTTGDSKKPLSAAQGKALKALYDAIPAWAKESSKPSYSKSDVGLGNVDNVRQYSASNPPPYPVKSVNGKTGAVTLGAADVGAATAAQFSQLSKEIADLETEVDGKQPKGDYALSSELAAETTAREQAVASLNARLGQQTVLIAEGETQEEAEAWLETDADKTKVYLMPDETFWQYRKTTEVVESGGGYKNLIDGTNGYIKKEQRYSASSSAWKDYKASGFIFASIVIPVPTSGDLTIRVRGMKYRSAYPTIYGGTTNTAFTNCFNDTVTTDTYDENGDWIFTLSNTAGMSYIITGGELTVDASSVIATVNEEIVEGGTTTVVVEKWASTGHGLVATNYDVIISELNTVVTAHTKEINALKDSVGTSLTDAQKLEAIKNWDIPIYDANIPVFELSAEKAAMTNATNTPDNIYAKYDALMAKHPRYITKNDLGLCSDGVNHVYRYDFREPEPHYESGKEWSETKTKAILMTGVHFEWAGIYSVYYALEEIADNPALRNLRRNTHLIVIPVANPYATIADNYQSGLSTPNSYGVRNANGVEIHRNFEVDWVASDSSSAHYGGSEPLSELETQYIDEIMKNNTDAALFLSAHNCGVDTFWGTGFIWSSAATKYMCNMGYRLVDKLSDAWMDKYGDVLSTGIEEYKTDALEDGDTRLGWAGLSTSPGTEAKQATKYGIQGTNIETCNPFQIHGTKENPEPSMSAFTMSRGAEVYVNFLLTAFGVYDFKDKEAYYK